MKVTLPTGKWDRGAWLMALLSGFFLSSLIYSRFLFVDGVLLYTDVGSDSVNIIYPYLVHLSDYIRSEGIPSWSFSVGMGQDLFYLAGSLVWQPVTWLPRDLIASALVYQHVIKTLLAGFLFCRFLQLRGLSWPASLLGSLLVSFSSYLCMGGCWVNLADEVVGFTAILLAAELALGRGRWWLLSLAVTLIGLISPFHLYLCALLLVCYVPARLIAKQDRDAKVVMRRCALLAGAACLGVGLGAMVTLPHLYAILNSPRGSGTVSTSSLLASQSVFGLASGLQTVTAILRLLANDAIGTANDFRGWGNYLEAPLTYCGLISLVLLPQAFLRASWRQRMFYALFLAGIVLSTIFPWFRHLFWLFQGDYYRVLSLFSILGLISLSMIAFSRYTEGRPLGLWLIAVTTFLLAALPYLPLEAVQARINPGLKLTIAFFLFSYGLLLIVGQLLGKQKLAAFLVVGLTMIELVQFDRITVTTRNTVTKSELTARVGYNDETVDAVRDIKASDSDKFYRITKLRPSGPSGLTSLNDALV
ncbi:MAG: YfhO family protein, partial [Verrucomicrobiota bacterium]|nr:YfhO family protein [Verrucomicrobiota bacterium]